MIYKIKERSNFKNFKVFRDNKLEPRAYFISFSKERDAVRAKPIEKRYVSDRVRVLNGIWDFRYYVNDKEMPSELDTARETFDKVKVPSCWQFTGYEPPYYTNVRYPYLTTPPKPSVNKVEGIYGGAIDGETYAVGDKQYNSIGVYRTEFTVEDVAKTYIISFLGVASNLELYMNGRYVGYSEGSHNTAEFELNDFIVEGSNEIVCVVHKWCNGSYMEDQDFFRNNGIFRDVLLFVEDKTYIYDFEFFTDKQGALYDAILNIKVKNPDGAGIVATLMDGSKLVAARAVEAQTETPVMFGALGVEEWNAEVPKLYTLIITLTYGGKATETIVKKVGFKTVTVDGKVFRVNGRRVKLLGVNHHDTDCDTGYYMTPEKIERDILLCKEFNVNCVRTSHYPPDPLFLELADLHGLYIIDEADIETHGLGSRQQISRKPKWKEHYWDRVYSMYMRDRNSPSVTMWSLGNESDGIYCQDYCYENLRKRTLLPIHYERAIATKRGAYDVASMMYTSVDNVRKIGDGAPGLYTAPARKALKTKPFFLCEYAHAMGVGPGSLEEYVDAFFRYDNLMGGCIWEMVDHAVRHGDDKPYKYTYGGDHGEYLHDGNFCVDGLFYPDRTPSTSAYAMKNSYRPLHAAYAGGGMIELHNRNAFRNASYLTVKCAMLLEGKIIYEFTLPSDIAPGESRVYNLNCEIRKGDIVVNLDYYDGDRLVACDHVAVNRALTGLKIDKPKTPVRAYTSGNMVDVMFAGGKVRFDKNSGSLLRYEVDGVDYFADRPAKEGANGRLYTNIFRAPTDNDMNIKKAWSRIGYDKLNYENQSFNVFSYSDRVEINAVNIARNGNKKVLIVKDSYTIEGDGVITVRSSVTPFDKNGPDLPRVGKIMELKPEFDDVIYYGFGGRECYPDFKSQSRLGVYHAKVAEFEEPYIRPQECGNRTDVRYAVFTNEAGKGVMVLADNKTFDFGVKKYSSQALATWKHREDIVTEDVNYITIDGYMGGIGSNSCGPRPMDEYRLKAKRSYTYGFKIVPFTALDVENILDYSEKK